MVSNPILEQWAKIGTQINPVHTGFVLWGTIDRLRRPVDRGHARWRKQLDSHF